MIEPSPTLTDHVFRIAGNRAGDMGTGFAVHRDAEFLYIVTCRHVVEQVGEGEKREQGLTVDGKPAQLVCWDIKQGFDLAVLRVAIDQLSSPLLPLHPIGQSSTIFHSAGFYKLTDYSVAQELRGALREHVQLFSEQLKMRSSAWWIEVEGDARLEPGHSGAPVVNEQGAVIAVISMRQGEGQRGLAISIEALRHIWPDMPATLLVQPKAAALPLQGGEPLMDCVYEIAAFHDLLDNAATTQRAILLQGDHGCGKTRLLTEYRQLAEQRQRKVIGFDLGKQLSVERCLERIVDNCADPSQFAEFDQSLRKEKPESLSRQADWHVELTRAFFADLRGQRTKIPLFVFFDHVEKADRPFRTWLLDEFVARLEDRPLLAVLAGRAEVDRARHLEWVQFFTPKIPQIKHFYEYAERFAVQLEPTIMNALFMAFQATPKSFVDYVDAMRMQQRGQPA